MECSPAIAVLDALFSTVKLPRIVTGPNCGHTKVREKDRSFEHNQQGLFFNVTVNSKPPRRLKDCIQNALYNRASNRPCLLCEADLMPGHRFHKFRTLPEVLIILINRSETRPGAQPGAQEIDVEVSHARCEVPDLLDLSEFREEEDQSRDQSAAYRYAAAVFHQGTTMDSGHYVTHVCNKDGRYFLLDDNANPRVRQSSMKDVNNARHLDATLVAYVKVHKKMEAQKPSPDAEERVLTWWRDSSKQEPPKKNTPDQNPPNQSLRDQNRPDQEPLKPDKAMPNYGNMAVEQLKSLMKERGRAVGTNKHPLEWYFDKLRQHDAHTTTYDDYTVAELKAEIARRGLDLGGINTKAAALMELERDDRDKTYKGPSMRFISNAQQPEKPPGKSAGEAISSEGKPERKPSRPPRKKKQPTKSKDSTAGELDGNNDINPDKQASEGPAPDKAGMGPLAAPRFNPDRFAISATLQIMGKSSDPGAEQLTHTWSLPANHKPNWNLSIIGELMITVPDGQKAQYPMGVSDKQVFHMPSLTSANKKRKAPSDGGDGADGDDRGYDGPQPPKKLLKIKLNSPRKPETEENGRPKDSAIEETPDQITSASLTSKNVHSIGATPTAVSTPSDAGSCVQLSPVPSPSKAGTRKPSSKEPRGSTSALRSQSPVEDEEAARRDAAFFQRFGMSPDAARKAFGGGAVVTPPKAPPKPPSLKKPPSPRSTGEDLARARKSGSSSSPGSSGLKSSKRKGKSL